MKRVSGQGDRPPHGQEPAGWPLPAEAEAWARHLVGRLKQAPLAVLPRWVVGADVAYDSGVAVAAAVVWDLKEGFPVWWRALRRPISAPYQPGLFFLREAPCLLPLLQRLPVRRWVGMVHGHGTAHPWGVGLACVVGALLKKPFLGCAGALLCGQVSPLAERRGNWVPVTYRGRVVGALVRTRDQAKPVAVSVGHRLKLPQAVQLVLATSRYRLPEPLRLADQLASAVLAGALPGASLAAATVEAVAPFQGGCL